MIRVLGLPTRHPYTSKFHQSGIIEYINPNTDYFNGYGGQADPEFINKTHIPESYDVVHIHFSFDKLTATNLEELLKYFRVLNKPIIWTCHSRESQREKNLENGQLQKLLFEYSHTIIAPTAGCKNWIENKFGKYKTIEVIPLGYMADPDAVLRSQKFLLDKKKDNFVYLVGECRKNKEINQTIINFLQCTELINCNLTVIVKPLTILTNGFEKFDARILEFWRTVSTHPRIKIISMPEISNDLLTQVFCESHVCLLPYLWGTHSGQVELCRDCGCYPVISDVGYYAEQSDQVVSFEYSDKLMNFANNFTNALVEAYTMELLAPNVTHRKNEFELIMRKHIEIYKSTLN